MDYLDFEIIIEQGHGANHPIRVRSKAGETRENFISPFHEDHLRRQQLDVHNILRYLPVSTGAVGHAASKKILQAFGQTLFNALFVGEVRSRYDVCLQLADQEEKGVRIKLVINAPELAVLPWEFLFDERENDYVCLSSNTPLVRYLKMPRPIRPLRVNLPVRVLCMVAGPRDKPALDVSAEKAWIERALDPLQKRGMVELTWLAGQTRRDLHRVLRDRSAPWHVYHFIGHGGYDTESEEGYILLETEEGRSAPVGANDLGRLLANHGQVRLVVLNSCDGARGNKEDVFASTASTLLRRGIPAVIAMQYEIADTAALEFARTFYEVLAEGGAVDAAIAAARIAMQMEEPGEWGKPVLYMRAPDGKIFNKPPSRHKSPPRPKPPIDMAPERKRVHPGADGYSRFDVFTPTKPARLTFVERAHLSDQLLEALATPGMQLAVYGPSGSGKSTLLQNKLEQISQRYITTRCTIDSTFYTLVRDCFNQLGPFYTLSASEPPDLPRKSFLRAEYQRIKDQFDQRERNSEVASSSLPQSMSAQRLAEFLGAAKRCWVIEDFHRVATQEKVRLSQSMKVFMDEADNTRAVKIIVIGASNTARQVIEHEPDMRSRVAEILVPLMKESEIREIISKGENLLNLSFDVGLKRDIAHYSSGLASVCHRLCLCICQAAGVSKPKEDLFYVQEEHLEAGIRRYLENSSDTVKSVFDKALKVRRKGNYDNSRLIIEALSRQDAEGATYSDLLLGIKYQVPRYPEGNLSKYLKALQGEDRGAIIRHDPYSGRYSFSDPLYRGYALLLFGNEESKEDSLINQILGRLKEIDKSICENTRVDF